MLDDAFDMNKMNVNPGGPQQVMRDEWWAVKASEDELFTWCSKGYGYLLEERDIKSRGIKANKMKEILGSHPDFKKEKLLNSTWWKTIFWLSLKVQSKCSCVHQNWE